MNKMRELKIEKITLNVGAGKEQDKLEKGIKLIKAFTGINPVKTVTQERIPTWGLRPGLPIGCKLTLRGAAAKDAVARALHAKDNILKESQFDNSGNVSFGLTEYVNIPGMKYAPEIGMMGFELCITMERPGYRIKKRKLRKTPVPMKHRVTKQESMEFMKKMFNVKIVGEEK
jgi:large subunit ribosomal protein L5